MRPNSDRITGEVLDVADVTARMLALLSTLQMGRSFTGEELAARLEVSARTVRRDVDRLRSYGYSVDTQPGPGGFYRLASGQTMPPLVLDDDEAVATLVGLATLAAAGSGAGGGLDDAAGRAYGKFDQFLPRRLRPRAASIRASLEAGGPTAPAVAPSTLAALADAIASRTIIRFDYRDANGRTSERRVEPHRQVHLLLRWYLLGWDLVRADWRTYRIDRIAELTPVTAGFVPRPLPADSGLDYVRHSFHAGKERVTVVVDAPVEGVVDALSHQDVEIVALSATQTRVATWIESWQWLVLNLAFLEAPFTVVEPDGVRRACAGFALRLAAATLRAAR